MKKKGFTLIELLAVIVILAIIALIAVPIVLDVIKDSKDSSNKRSIELYGSAVEQAVARQKLNGNALPSGKYTTTDGKTLTQGDTTFKVDYDGSKTVCDVIISTKGNIYLKNCKVSDKSTEYTYGEKIYENGEVVYFNVDTGEKCDNYTETQSNTGVKSGCMKFYAFNDDGEDRVNLLLDHNTTATVAWNSSGSTVNGPKEGIYQLYNDTESWQGTETPSNYTLRQSKFIDDVEHSVVYTIDYSSYNARLITAQEIAMITGYTSWDETTAIDEEYLFIATGTVNINKYEWLLDNTYNCITYVCNDADSISNNNGYWTASSSAYVDDIAWCIINISNKWNGNVIYDTRMNHCGAAYSGDSGVRPVIEVLKSKLS